MVEWHGAARQLTITAAGYATPAPDRRLTADFKNHVDRRHISMPRKALQSVNTFVSTHTSSADNDVDMAEQENCRRAAVIVEFVVSQASACLQFFSSFCGIFIDVVWFDLQLSRAQACALRELSLFEDTFSSCIYCFSCGNSSFFSPLLVFGAWIAHFQSCSTLILSSCCAPNHTPPQILHATSSANVPRATLCAKLKTSC